MQDGDALTLIINGPDDVAALTGSPLLDRVLRVEFNSTQETVAPILGMLPNVRSVTFVDDPHAAETVRAVDEHLPNTVRALNFAGFMATTFDDDTAAALCRSPRVAQLEHLALYNCNLTQRGAHAIGGGTFRELKALHLGLGHSTMNRIGPEGVAALTPLSHLVTLDLGFNHIGDQGVRSLRAFRNLTELHLQGNGITNKGLLALCDLPFLHRLTFLDLSQNRITARAMRHLHRTAPRLAS